MNAPVTPIRQGTLADIDAGIAMVRDRYPNRSIDEARHWIAWLLQNKNRLVLIGSHSVGCAEFTWKYGFEPRARLGFLAAKPSALAALEPLRMVRMMIKWAKDKGAKGSFVLDADTGVDFGPFAARLGGVEKVVRRWEIPLEQ